MPKMEGLLAMLTILTLSIAVGSSSSFNVMNHGAVGNGKTDDSGAFLKAWKAVCQTRTGIPTLIIPAGKTFLLKPVNFTGPCKTSHIYIKFLGNVVAPSSKSGYIGFHIKKWLAFTHINGLMISGTGNIDGRGSAWWSQPCLGTPVKGVTCHGPTALTFHRCHGMVLKGLRLRNSQRNHITITASYGVTISKLDIRAPENSPNTDGINIASSTNVRISDSFIGTGDDCIAISSGSSKINITNIECGPGHGISIGALGVDGEKHTVEEIHVRNCTFKETMNGVRIKTWQGGVGYARKISFDKIRFIRAGNPLIIDQFYCPSGGCQNKTTSAVKISDVSFTSIVGTSSTDKVINLSCDQKVACTNIKLNHVYISSTVAGRKAYAFCYNAHGVASHVIPSVKCLEH